MKRILIIAVLTLISTGCSEVLSVETNGFLNEEVLKINEEKSVALEANDIALSSFQYDENLILKDSKAGDDEKTSKNDFNIIYPELALVDEVCSTCADLLSHIALMKGYSLTVDELKDEIRIGTQYSKRLALSLMAKTHYKALEYYEKTILGRLVDVDKIEEIMRSPEFNETYNYLKAEGLI